MKEKVIKVLRVEPRKEPEIVELRNDLDSLQKAVSIGADYQGLIEIISLDEDTCVLCNEEGKLIGLEPNRRFYDDVLVGVFYVCGQDRQGNLSSLSKKAIEYYTKVFADTSKVNVTDEDLCRLCEITVL